MTDKEMALAIGEEVIQLRGAVQALRVLILNYRVRGEDGLLREIPWREDLPKIESDRFHLDGLRESSAQLNERMQAAGDESFLSRLYEMVFQTPAHNAQ